MLMLMLRLTLMIMIMIMIMIIIRIVIIKKINLYYFNNRQNTFIDKFLNLQFTVLLLVLVKKKTIPSRSLTTYSVKYSQYTEH